MPYIATDLDAFDDADAVAGSTGLPPPMVLGGLARTWRWCWRNKTDRVTAEQIAGFFCSPVPGLPSALVAFGFLEAGDTYRVRGVDRYLRLSEARRRGGLAAKSNLVPGARQRKKSLGMSREGAQSVPGITSGSDSALSAKVEGRRSNSEDQLPLAGEPPPAAGKVEVENAAARDLREAWNELTPPVLARWRESAGRNKVAAAALKRRPLEQWREVFARIGRCPRLHVGIGEAGWKANPDWAIRKPGVKAEPAQQVLEGAWDGPVSTQTGQRRPTGADPNQGILTRERVETPEEIEEANRRAEEWVNGG